MPLRHQADADASDSYRGYEIRVWARANGQGTWVAELQIFRRQPCVELAVPQSIGRDGMTRGDALREGFEHGRRLVDLRRRHS